MLANENDPNTVGINISLNYQPNIPVQMQHQV